MKWLINRNSVASLVVVSALIVAFCAENVSVRSNLTFASNDTTHWTYEEFVKSMAAHHKAPFRGKQQISQQQFLAYSRGAQQHVSASYSGKVVGGTNSKVNQDRDPWPKNGVGAAVNPLNGQNYVVMSNDYRQYLSHQYYHVSTDGSKSWTDDAMTGAMDPAAFAPYSIQSDPGVAFDLAGHSFISAVSSNLIGDFNAGYVNYDTEIDLVQGEADGTYTSNATTPIDYVPCNGNPSPPSSFNCQGQLDKPFVTVDNTAGSPTKGSIYVYYTYFCNGSASSGATATPTGGSGTTAPAVRGILTATHVIAQPASGGGGSGYCVDGDVSLPPFTSAILEAHALGAGLPFSKPALVSGSLTQAEYASMVIDKKGTPHIFFDDFSLSPRIGMYESTLINGNWSVASIPAVNFQYNGLNNTAWGFDSVGTVAPGCTIYRSIAYCAFAASQVGNGPLTSTPDVYLAKVDTAPGNGSAIQVTRVNDDTVFSSKDHFFPWATVTSQGNVYVGWYDDRNDPFNTRVQYFVGKSTNGGRSFPIQEAVSDTSFNPCAGYPGCISFGDYYQLVIGPDDVIHATWADTRDGASMQLYTQTIHW